MQQVYKESEKRSLDMAHIVIIHVENFNTCINNMCMLCSETHLEMCNAAEHMAVKFLLQTITTSI